MSSADTRAKLDHPVIDADGHMLEYVPVYLDFLKQVAGPEMVARYVERSKTSPNAMWYSPRRSSAETTASGARLIGPYRPAGPWTAPPRCCHGF